MLAPIDWPVLVNVVAAEPRMVALHNGEQVDSASESWRAECEARALLRMPSRDRRIGYLVRVEKKRGEESRAALEALALEIWQGMRRAG